MIVTWTTLAGNVDRFAVKSKATFGQCTRDRAALTEAIVTGRLDIVDTFAVPIHTAVVFTSCP